MKFFKFVVSTFVFLLFFTAIIVAIVLVSAGLLAIPASLSVVTGIFTNIISDLSPLSMFFAGISCISAGLAVILAVVIFLNKAYRIWEN